MPKKTVLTLCVLLCCALAAPAAPAQDSNANCRNLDDPSASGWTSYAQKVAELERIEQTSKGRVEVEVFGQSSRGRDLHAATVAPATACCW